MKVVAVIPMKLNNSRLPGKNIKPFTNGEPLCKYIQKTMLNVHRIDQIYVYCSNDAIKQYLEEGVEYLPRPTSLDTDQTSMTDVLQSFAREVDANIYVMSHTTAPFISSESIQKGLDAVLSGEYDSSFAVTKMQDFLWDSKKPLNYSLDSIPRTQDLPPIFVESSGFYIYTRKVITELNRRIGLCPKMIEIKGHEAIDIDEMEDFIIADAWFNYISKKNLV